MDVPYPAAAYDFPDKLLAVRGCQVCLHDWYNRIVLVAFPINTNGFKAFVIQGSCKASMATTKLQGQRPCRTFGLLGSFG